jgi:hypothetical protein
MSRGQASERAVSVCEAVSVEKGASRPPLPTAVVCPPGRRRRRRLAITAHVVPHPESLAAQAAYPFGHSDKRYCPDQLRPELFPGIGVLPRPATGSHIVIRGTPVAPLGQPQLNVPEKKSHPRGRPLQPRFPKEPHHRRAADDSQCVSLSL